MSDKKDDISSGMYGGYISKVAFNNGQSIDINKNDIVIFVGPNNVGKSQALKDIYALFSMTCRLLFVLLNLYLMRTAGA